MQIPEISLIEWQKRFGTERRCAQTLVKVRWPQGFQCPACGGMAYPIASRHLYQCAHCRHQVSITADTLFHATKIPLVKWFWLIYLMASDKGGISALRAAKHLGVSWITARAMLYKIRQVPTGTSIYRLSNLIELDDTVVGGKRSGKRGRGAEGKAPCARCGGKPGKGSRLSCHAGGRQRVRARSAVFSLGTYGRGRL